MAEQAAQVALSFLEKVLSGQDLSTASSLCAPHYLHHDLTAAESVSVGLDDFLVSLRQPGRQTGATLRLTAPPAAAGNKVALEWTLDAAGQGEPKRFISTHRIEGDRVAETWVFLHLPAATPSLWNSSLLG